MHLRLRLLLIASLGALVVAPRAHSQVTAPTGWSTHSARGVDVFTPNDLVANERYSVTLFPSQNIGAVSADEWLSTNADLDARGAGGRIERRGGITRSGPALLNTTRILRTSDGAQLVALYFAVSATSAQPQLIRVLANSSSVLQRYQGVTAGIVRDAGATRTQTSGNTVGSGTQTPELTASPAAGPIGVPGTDAPVHTTTPTLTTEWPVGGDVPATTADVEWEQALAMSLDPYHDILPARYECFVGDKARRVSPRADGLLTVRAGGSYRYESATRSGDGQWVRLPRADGTEGFQFTGPLAERKAAVVRSDAGQRIRLHDGGASTREMLCYIAGPASEIARIQMVNTTIANETLSCRFADGALVAVTFAGGQYSSTRGGGVYRDYSLLEGSDVWAGGFEFDGGPFQNARGYLRVDNEGRRKLEVGVTTNTSRGYWYSNTETTPVAECLSSVPPRRIPMYGRQLAPRTGVTGGPSGQFAVQRYNNSNNTTRTDVYTFTSDGWFTDDDPTYPAIDCARTVPSGAPRCSAYALSSGRIRMQDDRGMWGQATWEPMLLTPTKLTIGAVTYPRLAPLTGVALRGEYTTESGVSSGSVTGVLTSIVTEGTYVFKADGTFRAASSLFSRIGIGTGPVGGGAIGSSSSSRDRESSGRYHIDGNWLVLTATDGREVHVFIHTGGSDRTPLNQSPEYLYIDGSLYSRK